jgi:hypothetical protein
MPTVTLRIDLAGTVKLFEDDCPSIPVPPSGRLVFYVVSEPYQEEPRTVAQVIVDGEDATSAKVTLG